MGQTPSHLALSSTSTLSTASSVSSQHPAGGARLVMASAKSASVDQGDRGRASGASSGGGAFVGVGPNGQSRRSSASGREAHSGSSDLGEDENPFARRRPVHL